jgi:MerR family copper efflux transcriptional regulator
MAQDLPIACSLDRHELPERLSQMSALGKDALVSIAPDGSLRFRDDEGIRSRLQALVDAESRCCPFLDFDLREGAGELALTVNGPDEAAPVVRELVAAFGAGSSERPA